MTPSKNRCTHIRKSGERCKGFRMAGSTKCYQHDPRTAGKANEAFREAQRRAKERQRLEEQERERDELERLARIKAADFTKEDLGRALESFRRDLDSDDERIRQTASRLILEWIKGRPAQQAGEEYDARIIFETSFVPPEEIARTFDPEKEPPPPGVDDE